VSYGFAALTLAVSLHGRGDGRNKPTRKDAAGELAPRWRSEVRGLLQEAIARSPVGQLECLGETLRHALNALATAAPEWLRAWVPAVWFDRYGRPFADYRLPPGRAARYALAEGITNVETTRATTTDFEMTGSIHDHLAARDLIPAEHYLDAGYLTADHLVTSGDSLVADDHDDIGKTVGMVVPLLAT